ncbi:MAG: DNA mismatch repair protein MutL, partial [Chloroflexota bacterium]|nr:DNA mismatch repair protein MutL [Chloroflexota bacterium]
CLRPAAAPGAPPSAPGARAVLAGARPASPLTGASRWGPAVGEARGEAALPLAERLPALRPLGQFDEAFLVAEAPDGLYLVDQHAAHERVRYEEVRARLARGEVASQPLLEAELATLGAAQAALAAEEAEALAALGFVLEPTDGSALIVRAVPASLAGREPAQALRDLLDKIDAEERVSGPERAAASLACHSAVRAGDRLAGEQQRELLRQLEACEHPQTCPHGRPTLVRLSSEQVRRSFGRR